MSIKLNKDTVADKSVDILGSLNPNQQEAIIAKNGPVLIIAGAGSGKTRVLTYRVAYLINSGVKPWNILALTFTNKAAGEMKDRIAQIVSRSDAEKVWAGTFHSVFARVLRYEAERLGYTSSFTIYDADDQLSLIKSSMEKLGFSPKQLSPQFVRSKISMAKNKLMDFNQYSSTVETVVEKNIAKIYEIYEKTIKSNNAMDFDDLLLNMYKLLNEHKDILAKYQDRFHYIMVDEFQDTNRVQYEIIKLLAKARGNICVVGDDAQSIYRWRGADIQNILDYQNDYPYCKVVKLEQNYRSTKNILGAASCIIKNNINQLEKKLWTNNQEGSKIRVHACEDERGEADTIVRHIEKNLQLKPNYSDFAILYRTNAQSLILENALRRSKIPYRIVGGVSFYKRKEIKDALSYLRILVNPRDGQSLLRIVNEPPRGLGQVSLAHLQNYASNNNISLLKAFEMAEMIPHLQKRGVNAALKFNEMIDTYVKHIGKIPIPKLITQYIEETGLLEMYKEINTDDALDRWNNLQQLLSDAAYFFKQNPDAKLDDYIEQLSLMSDIDNLDTSTNKVTLMTLHSAKGLEFPTVFIAGLEKGLFPLSRSESEPEEEEEERRLFYVGVTRAEEHLHLTYSIRRTRFGEMQHQLPSPFISEIDWKYIESDAPALPKRSFRNATSPTSFKKQSFFDDIPDDESYSQIPEHEVTLQRGDRVRHAHFGGGQIISISGVGNQMKAVVNFESVGRKTLMLKYAKLSKM